MVVMQWSQVITGYQAEVFKNLKNYSSLQLNEYDDSGYTALSYALYRSSVEVVKFLLQDLKVDSNVEGFSGISSYDINIRDYVDKPEPSWKAAILSYQNPLEKLQLLKEAGTDFNAFSSENYTTLS